MAFSGGKYDENYSYIFVFNIMTNTFFLSGLIKHNLIIFSLVIIAWLEMTMYINYNEL